MDLLARDVNAKALANRLRGVSSTLAIARKYKLPFAMYWASGDSFPDDRWQDLPEGSFKDSGTYINTLLLAFDSKGEHR